MREGLYLYCIISSDKPQSFGLMGIGDRSDELYTVCFDDLAAVVSKSPMVTYSISRENTLAHERAIEGVMKEHAVLPVRFGTIAEDELKIKRILEKEHDRFVNLLNIMANKKELGLKAIFKEEYVYKGILEKYEDIRDLKQRIAALPSTKTYYQRMEIGKMVETALQKEREIHKKHILNVLMPLALETKINTVYGERMILNAAFLVAKIKETEFDLAINELADKYTGKIRFTYIGTVPPFNFVNLVIETSEY